VKGTGESEVVTHWGQSTLQGAKNSLWLCLLLLLVLASTIDVPLGNHLFCELPLITQKGWHCSQEDPMLVGIYMCGRVVDVVPLDSCSHLLPCFSLSVCRTSVWLDVRLPVLHKQHSKCGESYDAVERSDIVQYTQCENLCRRSCRGMLSLTAGGRLCEPGCSPLYIARDANLQDFVHMYRAA